MKILVAYYSLTGNTAKVAAAVHEEASQVGQAELKKLEEVDPQGVNDYDFVFVGSPLHAGNLASPVKEFLGKMEMDAGKKLAGFVTHAAPAYPEQELNRFVEPVHEACRTNGLKFAGAFTCQGFLAMELHDMIRKNQGLTEEEWAEKAAQMSGHPDERDLQNARSFTGAMLKG